MQIGSWGAMKSQLRSNLLFEKGPRAKSRARSLNSTLAHIMPTHYQLHCDGCPYQDAAHLPAPFRRIRSAPLSMEDNCASVLLTSQYQTFNVGVNRLGVRIVAHLLNCRKHAILFQAVVHRLH